MAENQEQMKPKDREIPVFTVLKNNCILKNIFVIDNPPPISSSSSLGNADQESETEEILLVGRHPDCNIKLEHPSISRFHLRIHSKPSSRSLFVTDLTSVHGTCISGKRIEPQVRIKLVQGDTLKLGESSRLYRLDWVPMSFAYEINDQFVPQLDSLDTVSEETEEDENSLSRENEWRHCLRDNIEGSGRQFSEGDLGLSMQKITAKEAPILEDVYHSDPEKDEIESSRLPEMCNKENEISSSHLCPLDASFAVDEETEEVAKGLGLGRDAALRAIDQAGDGSLQRNDECQDISDIMKDHKQPFCDEDLAFPMQKMSVTTPPQPTDELDNISLPEICEKENEFFSSQLYHIEKGYSLEQEVENTSSPEICRNENEFSSSKLCQIGKGNTPQPEDEVENIRWPEICRNENEIMNSQLCEINKENSTPQVHILPVVLQEVSLAETTASIEMNSEKRFALNIWSRRGKSERVKIETSRTKATSAISLLGENCVNETMLKDQCASPDNGEEISDKENASPDSCIVRSLGSKFEEALKKSGSISNTTISSMDEDEEVFTSDKENMTPNGMLRHVGSPKEVRRPNLHKPPPLKIASCSIYQEEVMLPSLDCQQRKILQEQSTCSPSKSHGSLRKQPYDLRADTRLPFLPLPVISTSDDKAASIPSVHPCTKRGSRSIHYYESDGVIPSHSSTSKVTEKRWTIVVDTACLLNKKSRRELQLLRGLRETSLVIPRIVLRELDCMVRRASFLSRMTEASAALQWIEECMALTKWWIQVQSSLEEGRLVPPTPPAASAHGFSEDKFTFAVGSIPFSPYNLQEIVTPTAADHILESALLFKQTINGQLILLSDDVTLKIKAMAEGVICETAKEFRASLVNPFSARFLYSDSSPRGPTWTCVDDTVLKEKYYPSPSKKATRSGEEAKGLKLILLHNSNFRQMRT